MPELVGLYIQVYHRIILQGRINLTSSWFANPDPRHSLHKKVLIYSIQTEIVFIKTT